MAKKIKRANLKPPGRCIFCGEGDMSKEHIFGLWLREIFPRDENSRHTHGKMVWPVGDRTHTDPTISTTSRQGHTGSKKVRVVCKKCNSTWLSGLEEATRPILLPMMAGQEIEITQQRQTRLAAWATKVAMTAEYTDPDGPLVPSKDRLWLKEQLLPPDGWCVFAAAYDGLSWRNLNLYQHRRSLDVSAVDDHGATGHYLEATTFGLNHLVFFVFSTNWERVQSALSDYDSSDLRRLWPLSGRSVLWPPLDVLSDEAVNRVANFLNWDGDHFFDPDAYRTITR